MAFVMHVIVKYNGKYYDPGTGLGGYNSIPDYIRSDLKVKVLCGKSGNHRWITNSSDVNPDYFAY